jgi:hypothetical protein
MNTAVLQRFPQRNGSIMPDSCAKAFCRLPGWSFPTAVRLLPGFQDKHTPIAAKNPPIETTMGGL